MSNTQELHEHHSSDHTYHHSSLPSARYSLPLTETVDGLHFTMPVHVGARTLDLVIDTGSYQMMLFNTSRCDDLAFYYTVFGQPERGVVECFDLNSPSYSPGVQLVVVSFQFNASSTAAYNPRGTITKLEQLFGMTHESEMHTGEIKLETQGDEAITFAIRPLNLQLPNVSAVLASAMDAGSLGPFVSFEIITYSPTPEVTWSLVIDGEPVMDTRGVWGKESISITPDTMYMNINQTTEDTVSDFILSSHSSASLGEQSTVLDANGREIDVILSTRSLHRFVDCSGLIGLGYPPLGYSTFEGASDAFLDLMAPFSEKILSEPYLALPAPVFALDLRRAPERSALHIGGLHEGLRDGLQWSPASAMSALHRFAIHSLSVCGQDLLTATDRATLPAIVDTGASCLSLPAEVFDLLVEWLPVECEQETLAGVPIAASAQNVWYSQAGERSCRLAELDLSSTDLPTLSFTVRAGGDLLHLPLERLLRLADPDPNTRGHLCLHRGYPIDDPGAYLSLGTMAVSSFYVAFDMPRNTVGLANKLAKRVSNLRCNPPTQCRGMQTRERGGSQCVDPPCSLYYGFVFDNTTYTCRLSIGFHIGVLCCLFLFMSGEVFIVEVALWLTGKVEQNVSPGAPFIAA